MTKERVRSVVMLPGERCYVYLDVPVKVGNGYCSYK